MDEQQNHRVFRFLNTDLLETLFDTSYLSLAYMNTDFTFIRVNQAYANAEHAQPVDFVGKNHFDRYPHGEHEATFRRVVQTGAPHIAYAQAFVFPNDPERYTTYWDWTLSPVRDRDGTMQGVLLCLLNVTAQIEHVNQHQQTRRALHESEERFRVLFEAAPDAIFLADPASGQIVDANRQACHLLQRSYDDVIGMHYSQLHPPVLHHEATINFDQSFHRHQQEHTVHPIENALLRTDGSTIPIEVLSQTVVINGKTLMQGIFRDIRERKRMEQTLYASEQRYRAVIAAMTEGIVIHDASGAIVTCNTSAERILGLTTQQLMGRTSMDPAWQTVYPDGRPFPGELHPAMVTLRTGEAHHDVIMGVRKPDGIMTWISINAQPIFHIGQEQPDMVIASFTDITNRRLTEARLRESERRFRMLAENARDIIFRYQITPGTAYDYISPSVTSILGYTPEEYYADPLLHRDQFCLSEQLTQRLHNMVEDGLYEPVLVHVLHKHGHDIWLEVHRWTVFDAAGSPMTIEGICRDVTERQRQQQLDLQQQQALAAMHERERMARELHDNLGQVLGYMHLELHNVRDLLKQEHIHQASTLLDQLETIVAEGQHDLHDFLRGVTHRPTSDEGFFAWLERYMQRYEQMYTIRAYWHRSAELQVEPFAQFMAMHLQRIIQEALNNVRKHAQATEVHLTFTLINTHVQIVIQDNGLGFDLEQQQAAIAQGQAGFGLRSMRERANEMGGHCRLDTAVGAGTQVIVWFPWRQPSHTPDVQALNVFLVDDHPLFLEGLHRLLVSHGIAVVGMARNGEDALIQARRLHPDIILMDIDMPGGDGLAATRRIKTELPDTQIVILTVSADEDHLFAALKNGASGYLLKNLDVNTFFDLLSELERGEVALSPELAQKLLHDFSENLRASETQHMNITTDHMPPGEHVPLSSFQSELLTLVAQGRSYREVGERLGYSASSIKRYMHDIIKTLHLRNRAAAIAYARKQGLV
ncbi:MAG: PAS domain S-box protein [Chloroflexaceae bacterium]|nr:PAS domain S-box protein [Chloroflexaceae bacterium]